MHVKRPTGTQVQDGEGKMIVVAVGENTYQESLLAEKPKDSNEAAEECTYAYLSYTHLSHACLLRVSTICLNLLIFRCCLLYLFFLMHHPLARVRLALFSHVFAHFA
jgi:magnesium-transporting ATPase (P-type)